MTPVTGSLKVVFLIDSLGTGGAERELVEKLPTLRPFGIVPIVVALRPRHQGVQQALVDLGFDVRVVEARSLPGKVAAVRRILEGETPDLMETTLFNADLVGRLAALGTSVRVVTRLVNTDYELIRLGAPLVCRVRARGARLIDGLMARYLTDCVYANSESVRNAAVQDLHLSRERVAVVPCGRDANRLGHPGPARRQIARRALGLEPHHEVLVNVGRQDYQKGQWHLLEAVAQLVPSRPHLVLLIAGRRGDVSQRLERLCDQLRLGEHVRFLEHREDVPEILAAADLFVFSSLYEGLPGAVIEAMALGLPVVAFDIDPVQETVENGGNAWLVPRGNSTDLAEAVRSLLTDPDRSRSFGVRGRALFEERYGLDRVAAASISLYRRVVSAAPDGQPRSHT